MSGKMDTVKTGSSAAKARILSQAAADLAKMHFERCVRFWNARTTNHIVSLSTTFKSTERFNRLITLEAQYADYGRKLTHALDDCVQFNQNVCDDLQKIIHAHDRTSSMKLPKSLFPNRLPRSISKYLQ